LALDLPFSLTSAYFALNFRLDHKKEALDYQSGFLLLSAFQDDSPPKLNMRASQPFTQFF
jgi:hypothetical protein